MPDEKGPRDACGVFGLWAPGEDVSKLAYYGLYALQHRGQESAGIAVSNGKKILVYKDTGLVSQDFDEAALTPLQGHIGVGHTRHSGAKDRSWHKVHPALVPTSAGPVAIVDNGVIDQLPG